MSLARSQLDGECPPRPAPSNSKQSPAWQLIDYDAAAYFQNPEHPPTLVQPGWRDKT